MKRKKGRPPTKPAELMDGFYIEVRNKRSSDKGVRLRSETEEAMQANIRLYSKTKDIIVLGEYKNRKWLAKPIDMRGK